MELQNSNGDADLAREESGFAAKEFGDARKPPLCAVSDGGSGVDTASELHALIEQKRWLELRRGQLYGREQLRGKLWLSEEELKAHICVEDAFLLQTKLLDRGALALLHEAPEAVTAQRIVGLLPAQLAQGPYALDPRRMPMMGVVFLEVESARPTEGERPPKASRTQHRRGESRAATRETLSGAAKPKKNEFPVVATSRMKAADRNRVSVTRDQDFKTFDSIRRDAKRAKARSEPGEAQRLALYRDKWKEVAASVLKVMRYFHRGDCEQNARNLAMFCAKIKRKAGARPKKAVKEYAVRAKKLWKEAQLFWKRRVKEVADLRKKRERLEAERRRREEDREEQLRQRKKIEFLIQRSSIYAEIMSKKLGSAPPPPAQPLAALTAQERSAAEGEARRVIAGNEQRLEEYGGVGRAVDFSQVDLEQTSSQLQAPESFVGTLKDYQLKGLRWLDNLYSQGINGILADEMGLGKTIQALALLAHISSALGNWGPFLVIAPATTLFNWYAECRKFCPQLRALPFWGSKKERYAFRRNLQQKSLGAPGAEFHVVITSYQIAVTDEKVLHRVQWQYIILDEAQAIKNMNSQRWSKLLELRARNKLLLTGTPIQNTMAELWALLHFIMPRLFDSHEQFQEWFSKDIEAHSQNKQKLDQTQLDRLHAILKPFMLRRVKKDVETEIGRKFEHEVFCGLSARQRALYDGLKRRIVLSDFFYLRENRDKVKNLMNLVMQLRKVCNHPEIFERKIVRTPLVFSTALAEPTHTVYSATEKLYVLRRNGDANPFSQIFGGSVWVGLRGERWSRLLHARKQELGALVGQPQLLLEFHIEPSDRGLLALLAARKYLSRTRSAHPLYERRSFWAQAVAEPLVRLDSGLDLRVEPRLITSRALWRTISEFYVTKVAAASPRLIRAHNKDGELRALARFSPDCTFRIEYPLFSSLIKDSSKLAYLDRLLHRFHTAGMKALIFCQMTKMLNLLEEYLQYRKYTYLRMDGTSQISERRDRVHKFQTNKDIFIFLLSTRAGGLGVTLTAADAVVFFDNDWNPTMDAQAADRAHRIGRREDVNVYRLITKGTIEERIVRRAKQKNSVHQTVYSGEVFKGNVFNTYDVMSLLFDESEIKDQENREMLLKGVERVKTKEKKSAEDPFPPKNGEQVENLVSCPPHNEQIDAPVS